MDVVRRLDLRQEATAVGEAREFTRTCCRDWQVADPDDVAALVVSELVTNALKHGTAPMTLYLGRRPDRLVISVEDSSAELALEESPDLLDESGRGLVLVARLADSWGEHALPDGKRVWAELAVPNPR